MKAWGLLAAAMVVASALVTTVEAKMQAQPYSGSGDYQAYCTSCHGADARGDGVIAKSLKKRPADLSQLTRRNNGIFPEAKIFKTIDGRMPGGAHSDSDMPALGDVFVKARESEGPENAAARISSLVKYLESLQVKE